MSDYTCNNHEHLCGHWWACPAAFIVCAMEPDQTDHLPDEYFTCDTNCSACRLFFAERLYSPTADEKSNDNRCL